jgi:hypothetical protein
VIGAGPVLLHPALMKLNSSFLWTSLNVCQFVLCVCHCVCLSVSLCLNMMELSDSEVDGHTARMLLCKQRGASVANQSAAPKPLLGDPGPLLAN